MSEWTAGPELDARVATEVMQWHRSKDSGGEYWKNEEGLSTGYRINAGMWTPDVWNPSDPEGIAAAWEVVEKLRSDGFGWILQNCHADDGVPWCCFTSTEEDVHEGQGDTAPLAICLAALKAVDVA